MAGYGAGGLAEILGAVNALALPVGIAIGLAALFFGGHHDDPATMPDKYDEPNYGQGVANLQGTAGATPANQLLTTYTEDSNIKTLFSGRTGIQMIEETLAQYGSIDNAPVWLKPMFSRFVSMFGITSTGSGQLLAGDGGSGKDCNNQEIVGVPGLDGQVHQYTQLDSALAEFQAAYAKARAAGQGIPLSWVGVPPSSNYASTSYQSEQEYLA